MSRAKNHSLTIYQVDAFTDKPFGGNPAAVLIMEKWPSDAWMQSIAMEMNLSETAFLVRDGEAWRLRWMTPAREVSLCGHATLATAHILWQTGALNSDQPALFDTMSGRLTCRRTGEWIEMDFPARSLTAEPPPAGLLEALGVSPAVFVGHYNDDWLIEIESENAVRALKPDFTAMKKLASVSRGVVVTATSSTPGIDFVSRFFVPGAGIDEDPVTGSTHCALTPYWQSKLGKNELTAWQASARGGLLKLRRAGDRVIISGQAVTVMIGMLHA